MTTGGDFDYKAFRKDWDTLLERQKYKEAEKLCHEGLAKSPLDQSRGRLYNHLGYLYENFLDDKTFDDILEHYVLSLQVDESNANSHYNLANFLLEQGMQHLLRALELHPTHGKANKRYANLTPIKANTTLDLQGHKYQVVEVVEDGVRAIRLKKRADGGYERCDDEPAYVEVGAPEKVYNSKGARTNMVNGDDNNRVPLEVDNGYNNNRNGSSSPSNTGCCYKCVLYWWFWAICWILAVGGIVVPVLGYMFLGVKETNCTTKANIEELPLNTETASQGTLNVLFMVDCGMNTTNQVFAANDLLSGITTDSDIIVNYDIMQYCNDNMAGIYIGNSSFEEYTAGPIDPNDYDQYVEVIDGAGSSYIAGAFEACQDVKAQDTDDSTPFLCIPFVSQEFIDVFEAMSITESDDFADIYLAFMVSGSDTTIYPVLGSFATATECIDRLESSNTFGNTWWSAKLTCNNNDTSCPHCINYGDSATLSCAAEDLATVFEGEGVTQQSVTMMEEECDTEYEMIYFYCIAAAVPLLIWVMIVIFVLCCNSCRNGNRQNMEAHNGLNNNENKQTAFV